MTKPEPGKPVRVTSTDGVSALHGVLEKETPDYLHVVPHGASKSIPLDKDLWEAQTVLPMANGSVVLMAGRHVVRVGGRWLGVHDGIELVTDGAVAHEVLFTPPPLPVAPTPPAE